MRILISASNLRRANIGGGETFVRGLAGALAATGRHDVGVLAPADAVDRMRADWHPSVELLPIRGLTGLMRIVNDWARLGSRATRWQADVVVFPHEWAPRVRQPLTLVAQNIQWMHPDSAADSGLRGRLLRGLVSRTSRSADVWVALSRQGAALWASCGGPQVSMSIVLPEGLDRPKVTVAERRGSGAPLAIVGELTYKRLIVLETAIDLIRREVPSYEVDIIGVQRPPAPGRRYHGCIPHPQVLELMASASVTVFPSAVESFGLPAFEATALGRPCVVDERSSMHEWLQDRVVTFDGTAEDLARALQSRTWGPQEPERRFLWENAVNAWEEALVRAASGSAPR